MCVSLLAVAGRELTSSHHYANPWRHNTSSIISHTRWVLISIQSIDCRYWWVVGSALFDELWFGLGSIQIQSCAVWSGLWPQCTWYVGDTGQVCYTLPMSCMSSQWNLLRQGCILVHVSTLFTWRLLWQLIRWFTTLSTSVILFDLET